MKNWLDSVALDLLGSDSLPLGEKLFSAITVICCLYMLRENKYICVFKEDVQIALLELVALPSDGAGYYQLLKKEMQRNNSQLVADVYANASFV